MKKSIIHKQIVVAKILFVSLAFVLGLSVSTQVPLVQSMPTNSNTDETILISNDQFVFHPSLYGFDIQGFLESQPGVLKQYSINIDGKAMRAADLIESTAYYYSINPQVLLAFLESKSAILSNPHPSQSEIDTVMGINPKVARGFAEQIEYTAHQMFVTLYEHAQTDASGRTTLDATAASLSLKSVISFESATSQAFSFNTSAIATQSFLQTFERLFGSPLLRRAASDSASTPPQFHYPWPAGGSVDGWKLGSLHAHLYNGWPLKDGKTQPGGDYPTGLDFVPPHARNVRTPTITSDGETCSDPRKCPCIGSSDTRAECRESNRGIDTDDWVIAASSGNIVYSGFSQVVVQHDAEWGTLYYHIATDGRVAEGPLPSDLHVGHPSSEVNQGGASTTSHVHFSILWGGVFQDARTFMDIRDYSLTEWNSPPNMPPAGVTLYELPNYGGHSLTLTQSDLDLCDNPLDPALGTVAPCFSAPSWTDAASSIRVSPGYRAVLHIHNQADADQWHDDATMTYSCTSDIPDFSSLHFPNGTPLDNNVSRVIVEKCGPAGSQTSLASPSATSSGPCDPGPASPSDSASFISDITLPNGTIVSPGQALAKSWRIKNLGTTTWGTGYELAFVSGEQMNAPMTVNVPASTPNSTADISINLTAPSSINEHAGYWQLRNPQGTYFGPRLSVKINVSAPSSKITIFTADPASPANTNKVRFHIKADNVNNFRAMRILVDGIEKYQLGAVEYYYDWDTAGYSVGDHSIVVEVADQSDTSWSHPYRKGMTYTLQGTTTVVNHQPNPPLPSSPYDWYVYYSGSTATLCAQAQGDPDGDAISTYYFEIHDSGQNWSGSSSNNCITTASLPAYTYQWHVKVQDSRGAVSDWSQDFHFTIVNQNLSITSFDLVPLDGNSENVRLKACVTGQGSVGITIRFLVNSATNGTDSGYWRNVGELGVPCFTDVDAPIWHTLEDNALSGNGQHLVRVEAHGASTGWNGAVSQDKVITLPHRRPSDSRLQAPIPVSQNNREAIFLNTRSIPFKWEKSDRATSYRLSISLNPSPKDDASPVSRQTYASGITQTIVTLNQDYPALYWQIEALNDTGSNASTDQLFGIDRITPTCSIQPLSSVSYENNFQVRWTGSDALSGIHSYNIQYKDSRSEQWSDWLAAVPAAKIYELFIGQAGHTYSFRCQAMDNAGNLGDYPSIATSSITIDPSSRPPEAWWNLGYASKRNLTIQNNMPALALPANYPVNVKFTSGTTPSAAEVYNLSQSTIKCDDLRIVSNNATELNRYVRKCAPDEVDLWFRTQIGISAGGTYTAYQMYLGNYAASNPPADAGQIWYPYREGDTTNLYLFQEGSGSTAYDYSGHNRNCTINPTVSWLTGKWGAGLRFSRANNGNTVSLTCGSPYPISALTAEFWWKSVVNNNNIDGRLAGQLGPNGQLSWLVSVESDRLKFERWCNGGSDQARGNINLRQSPYYGQWSYLAVTFNGGNQVKFYVNGNLDNAVTLGGNCSATYNIPLEIGSVEGGGQGEYSIGAFKLSNTVKTDFSPGSFASITNEPSTVAGSPIAPPAVGAPDLALVDVTAYANPGTGTLVQAIVQNQGNLSTQNGFYTDLYMNHLPTGAGDYTGSIQLWVNDPVAPGATVTLTTVITDLTSAMGLSTRPLSAGAEVSGTLYAQVDSTGVLSETTRMNNIYSPGTEVCVASPDAYESDDTFSIAHSITFGQSQAHNFSGLGDRDWIKFTATAGQTYLISTSNLGLAADTYLYLYGMDGITLLAANDDYDGSLASQIKWQTPSSGTYYVLVQHWNPNVSGCGTGYNVAVSRLYRVYLPNIMQNYSASATAQAAFTASPTSGKAPLNVQFTDQSSGSISGWLWDFGDGNTSSIQNPSHIYSGAGVYTVSLQVMSPSGSSTLIRTGYITATASIAAWTYTGNLNAARHGHTAILLPSGKVLVAGGYSNSGFTKSAELYDPATGQWSYTGNLNSFHHHHTATLLLNGKVLVVGGHDGSSPTVSAELYDPSTGLWSLTGSLTTARWMHTATLLQNGKVLVTGGGDDHFGVNYASSELYDPATGQWTTTGNLNNGRAYHTATRLSDGRVLVTGGCNGNSCTNVLTSAELYNPSTSQWTIANVMNVSRLAHTATLMPNGQVLVVGGCNGAGCITRLASAELYTPSSGQWIAVNNPAIARSQHIATLLSDGTVLVAGGAGNGDVALAGSEMYDGNTGQWSTTVSLNTARLFYTETLLPNGAVMVTSGCASSCSTRTPSVELFTK